MQELFYFLGIWSYKSFSWNDILGIFLFIAGFIIGLGAVTVIDLHGFLGRKSPYWTEATIRTHKITKPLIWAGMFLAILGGVITYRNVEFTGVAPIHAFLAVSAGIERSIPLFPDKSRASCGERKRGKHGNYSLLTCRKRLR